MATLTSYLADLSQRCPLLALPSSSAAVILLCYFFVLALLDRLLPGQIIPGSILVDKSRKYYKCNGFSSLLLLLLAFILGANMQYFNPVAIADKGGELLSTIFTFSFLASLLIFIAGSVSRSKSASLRPHLTGNFIHDWWFGVQLNPTFLTIDLKFFAIKSGMLGWFFLNLSVAAKQHQIEGTLSLPMVLYQCFSMIYLLDYFWFEEFMTSTWDIIAENFGFMLIFGDLVWIPFTFSIQGWWLLRHKPELTAIAAALNVVIFILGFAVFRGANMQKHIFKKDSSALIWGQPPKTIGGKLLVSGFW